MGSTSPSISPRRRAVFEEYLSLANSRTMSVFALNFPLPPSKQHRAERELRNDKPDFSGFSWDKMRLAPSSIPRLIVPVSPRTVLAEHPIVKTVSVSGPGADGSQEEVMDSGGSAALFTSISTAVVRTTETRE
ncbi:hypothetical protein VTI74DRAFT_5458 [Chaetomium olivicolor]